MKSAFNAVVSGRVQMVMFRDFTARHARTLGIVGTVENLGDGTVRVYAEGEKDKLEALVKLLWRGSLLSHVENVSVTWLQPTGQFDRFFILY